MSAVVPTISPAALAQIAKTSPIRLIDVRTPAEFAQVHALGATNVPLDQVDGNILNGGDDTVYVICRGGNRGQKACEKILSLNSTARVVNVDGGTLAWEMAQLPVVRGRKRMSLQRKVRVGAAVPIVISILLSIFVHRGLLGIAALVAAVLVFVGMTNWLGMGFVLGTMPWSRRTEAKCSTNQ